MHFNFHFVFNVVILFIKSPKGQNDLVVLFFSFQNDVIWGFNGDRSGQKESIKHRMEVDRWNWQKKKKKSEFKEWIWNLLNLERVICNWVYLHKNILNLDLKVRWKYRMTKLHSSNNGGNFNYVSIHLIGSILSLNF